jgi:hypothetical protein
MLNSEYFSIGAWSYRIYNLVIIAKVIKVRKSLVELGIFHLNFDNLFVIQLNLFAFKLALDLT